MPDLDSASMIIGELKGQFAALEKYIHNRFHDQAQQAQVQYNYLETILKELKAMRESDRQAAVENHDELEERIAALEAINTKRDGLMGGVDWLMKSPLVAWIAAAALWAWALITGRVHG